MSIKYQIEAENRRWRKKKLALEKWKKEYYSSPGNYPVTKDGERQLRRKKKDD